MFNVLLLKDHVIPQTVIIMYLHDFIAICFLEDKCMEDCKSGGENNYSIIENHEGRNCGAVFLRWQISDYEIM